MPSYVSHTIMARDVYKKLKNDTVDLDYMLTYSLGGDLSKFAKCRFPSHRLSVRDEFFNYLVEFVKKNNLEEDPKVKGVIYGHLCHYAFDDLAHPLIRKLCNECVPHKNNHGFLEIEYDIYLVNKKYKLPLSKYDNKALFKGKMTKEIAQMLDYAYEKTFDCKHLSRYYRFNIFLYKKIRLLYVVLGRKLMRFLYGIDRFLKKNKDKDIYNKKHKIKYKDINKKESTDDFDTVYKKSIEKAVKDIEKMSKLLNKKAK